MGVAHTEKLRYLLLQVINRVPCGGVAIEVSAAAFEHGDDSLQFFFTDKFSACHNYILLS